MTIFRQSYEAAKYHRRLTITFFLIFSISLILITFVSQLLSTEKTTLDNVSITVNDMKKTFPQISQDLGDYFSKNNHSLIQSYHHIEILLLGVSFFVFFLFGIWSSKNRKDELNSLYGLGVSQFKMIRYLLYELLIPLIIVCSFFSLVFIVAQQQIINLSFSTNQALMNYYFDDAHLDTKKKTEEAQSSVSISEFDSTDKTLVPYNKKSAFETKKKEQSIVESLFSYIKGMLLLIGLALSGCLIGFSTYIIPNFKRKRSFIS